MAKKTGKGENATAEDVAKEVMGERMGVPPAPSDDEFDRANAEVARNMATTATDGPPVPVDDMLARLTAAMEIIAAQGSRSGADDSALDRLAAAFERMAAAQLEGADRVARATKLTTRPENQAPPGISVFNLRGDKDFPKPPLKCRMLVPYPVEFECCTREEVELLNLLIPGEFAIRRNDGTKAKITIRATYKMDTDEMDNILLNHDTAFNNDNHQLMPPQADMLRQILKQNTKTRAAADMVLTMDEEAALILAGKLNDGTVPENKRVVSVGE